MYKPHLFYTALLLLGFCVNLQSHPGDGSTNPSNPALALKNNVNVDGLYLAFGAIDVSYERAIADRFSIYAGFALGNMWFTKIDRMQQIGVRYFIRGHYSEGFYSSVAYFRTALHHDSNQADVAGFAFLLGQRWCELEFLSLDVSGGLYLGNKPRMTFYESGNGSSNTVSLGGASMGINLKAGIFF